MLSSRGTFPFSFKQNKMKKTLAVLILLTACLGLEAQIWMEQPQRQDSLELYFTVYGYPGGRIGRNYTFRYDLIRKTSLWVAYPLNQNLCGRSFPEAREEIWSSDTHMPESFQPSVYRDFDWRQGYTRGFLLPPDDRQTQRAYPQSFRPVNVVPLMPEFKDGILAALEKTVRYWAYKSDTLFVVSGVIPGEKTVLDNAGEKMSVPDYVYKTVLRCYTEKDEVYWDACSVLLPHRPDIPCGEYKDYIKVLRRYTISIEMLEELTGETYFPLLESLVGETAYRYLKKKDPSKEDWWWKRHLFPIIIP